MKKYSSDSNDPPSRAVDFGEWLSTISEVSGMNREEALEELISSYWTVSEMSEQLESLQGRDDVYSDQVDSAFAPMRQVEFERFQEEMATQIVEVHSRITTLEEQTNQIETKKLTELESTMNAEFRHLQTIIKYLLETVTESGEQDTDLQKRFDKRMRRIESFNNQLVAIKNLALKLGVTSAKCDNCFTRVDLALLGAPVCPRCDRKFEDIEPRRKLLGFGFGPNRILTERTARPPTKYTAEDSNEVLAPTGDENSAAPHGGGPTVITGFEWGPR